MVYIPFEGPRKEMEKIIWNIIGSEKFKSELSHYVRLEIEASKARYSSDNNVNALSYDSLTRGNVNMQARMAASGYDVYGRTIIKSNKEPNNKNIYQNMKNKINYGGSNINKFKNNGQYSFSKEG